MHPDQPRQRIALIDGILLLAALVLLTFDIGHYGLFEPHEGHFAGVAREMTLRGDWVTPFLNGSPYLNKPPLLYWLIAISYRIFGINEFAARLPIALAGWVGVAIAGLWSRQLWGAITSRATVVFLSTSVGWFIFAHQLLIDELLGTLLLALMFGLWHLTLNPKSRSAFVAVYLLLGLAILAKGILALVFWAVACLAIALTRRRWQTLWSFRPLLGLAIAFAVVIPWLIAVERANPGFLQYFLLNENFNRALDTRWPPDYSISKISPWGYVAVSAVWCLPWILLLPPALNSAIRDWRKGLSPQAPLLERQHTDALTLLLVLATLPIVLFLPLSSRLYYYSIPALPPLAMMAGRWWDIAWQGRAERTRFRIGWMMTALGVVFTASLLWLPQRMIQFFPELAQTPGVQTIVTVQLIGVGVGFIGSGTFLLRKQMAIALVLLWFGFGTSWTCVIQGFKTIQDFRSSKTLVSTTQDRLKSNALWIFEGSRELGAAGAMSFYLNPDGIQVPKTVLQPKRLYPAHSLRSYASSNLLMGSKEEFVRIPLLDDGHLPQDWIRTPSGTFYQLLFVLKDGGPNRLPPRFPGAVPPTLISKDQMQTAWNGDRPVVFVTDFLRLPNDPTDPPDRNVPHNARSPLLQIGPRTLYGNAIARKLWLK
ncbi:MAG: glycosyltransferase family 39 protein [Thermosynechococcaceae cyanobacterium]